MMLELDVLEQRHLNPLESSLSRTVPHRWSGLHVPFIHELQIGPDPTSDPGNLDQIALHVNVQEAHCSLTEISEDTKIIPELLFCARKKDTREQFTVNSAVMLDTVEKVSPMEICDSAPSMMNQESGESSNLQIREDFLEISIAHDHTNQLNMRDGHNASDPRRINAKTAGMEVMGTGAVLQSEQSESVGNLANEPHGNEHPDLEMSNSVNVLPEMSSTAATETHTSSIEGSPGGLLSHECTALMSSSPKCTAYNTGDFVKCLEVEHLPHLQSTSAQRTFQPVDFPKAPTSFHKASVCKEQGFSCINEVRSAICLLKPNSADDINGPQENEPEDKDLDMSIESGKQETVTTSPNEKQNDISIAYPSKTTSAETESTTLQDSQSDTSNVGLQLYDKFVIENDSTSPGTLEDDLSFKSHLPPCLENVTSAKTLDTEECSSSSSMSDCNTPLSDGTPDCQKYTCANKLEDGSDSSSHSTLCPDALANLCRDPSYARSARSSLVDCIKTSYIDCNSHNRDTEPGGETEEQFMSVAPETNLNSYFLPVKTEDNQCSIAQTDQLPLSDTTGKRGLCDNIPAVVDDTPTSLKIAEDSHSLVDSEVSHFELNDSNTVFHKIPNSDQSMTPPHMQSNLLVEMKDTVLTSNYLTVPCRTVGYRTDETPSYALVPYVDIWDSFSKSEINSLSSLRKPINVINKTCQSQEFKKDADELKGSVKEGTLLEEPADVSMEDDCMLNAFKNPVDGLNLYSGKYKEGPVVDAFIKMGTLLAQEVTCDVSLNSFTCHSIKMFENRASSIPPTINQLDMCRFTSAALCDSSVALDANNMPVFPQLGDNRRANVCFLKEKCAHHLSLSHQHLDDCSALPLPTSSPISKVALNESKNSLSEVLDSSRLHVTDPSVPLLDGLGKSLSLIQDAELGATLKETFKASDSVQILAADINGPAQSVRLAVLGENRSPLMLHVEKCLTRVEKPSPVKSVVSIKTKATRVKSRRNVLNAEIKIHEKLLMECQSLRERTGQSAGCQVKMRGTAENWKQYNLRPAPQSLNCSTSQEAKRPKIFHVKDVLPVNSGPLTCVDKFSQKSESHCLSQPRQACNRKETPNDVRRSSLDTNISVKRQPHRKCKSFVTRETLPIDIKAQTCKSFPVLKTHNSHDINVGYRSFPAKHVALNLTSKLHYSKPTKGGALRPTHLLKSNQDQMLLTKLSKIANRLTTPSKAETFSNNLKVIPFRGVKIQARKLLNVFSCVRMRMNFQPGQIGQDNVCLTSSRDRLVSQSMNLYPKAYFSGLGDAFSLNTCDNLTFPVSFHVNVDPSCLSDFLKFNPPDFILRSPRTTAQSSELSEWTLSLFLSSHVPADTENIHLLTQWNPEFRSLESSSESNHTRKAFRKSGCSMLGLHTVLALSSPGCYRLWTRRRNLGSRIPTVQKLFVTQFAHGLKGSQPQFLRAKDQFSSLAFSLGRVLSTWSQHGLSTYSSDCANTHPNCSVLLPSQSSNSISVCRSPNALVCVPQLPLNTISQLNTYSLPVQNFNLNLKPSICLQEYLGLPFRLSAQQKDDPRSLWYSSPYKNDVELSNCSFRQEEVPKHSFIFSSVKKRNLNLPLDPSTQHKNNLERPLGLSSLKHNLKAVVNTSLLKDQNPTVCLDSHCDGHIRKDAAVDLPCPESPPKGQACPFEQRENMFLPSTQSQKEDLGNEKGAFERRPQRVSQIRIRKTIPKPDPNLTPMGLPKPKRVNKKEFSLEDIYTNKNYKSPPPARLETIFEEPKEKNGVLISVSQQKRKRILEFRDCTVPRIKRPKGKVKVMASCKRGRKAAMEGVQLDALLIQKLMDLDSCLMEEEAMESDSVVSKMPS
ncbi:protein PRR14L isoform X2 [Bufo gargarizans]|uniref:protein PRR14L isoform X2 n=1 Tax=Bufo gargarizans TaxID=30331 RepID=UPI001CF27B46|nr:protein PRR14L isoform X2 [Bufo gargarizans]